MALHDTFTPEDFCLYDTAWFNHVTFWESVQGLLYQRGIHKMNEWVEEHFHVSRTTIWRWKKGRGDTPISVIYALSEMLGMNLEDYRQMNFDAARAKGVFQDVWPKRF